MTKEETKVEVKTDPKPQHRPSHGLLFFFGVVGCLILFSMTVAHVAATFVLGLDMSDNTSKIRKVTPLAYENLTSFQKIHKTAFDYSITDLLPSCPRDLNLEYNVFACPAPTVKENNSSDCLTRYPFSLCDYKTRSNFGGLLDSDRILLGNLLYKSESIIEFGIGESTIMAANSNIPRYVGVESDAEWIKNTRSKAPSRFIFYFADIGPTKEFGFSVKELTKNPLTYQVAMLNSQLKPFDVYFVDGRYRVACALLGTQASFMHAISTNDDIETVYNTTRVLIHDYEDRSRKYYELEKLANVIQRSTRIAVFQLKRTTTEEQLLAMYNEIFTFNL